MINRRELLILASLGLLEGCVAKAGDRVRTVDHELRLLLAVPRPEYLLLPISKPEITRSSGDLVMKETFPHKGGGQTEVRVMMPYRAKMNDELAVRITRTGNRYDVVKNIFPYLNISSVNNPYCPMIQVMGYDQGPVGIVYKAVVRTKKDILASTGKFNRTSFYKCESKNDSDDCRWLGEEDRAKVGVIERAGSVTEARTAKGRARKDIMRFFKALEDMYIPRLAVLMTQEDGVVVGRRDTTKTDVKRLDDILYLATRI